MMYATSTASTTSGSGRAGRGGCAGERRVRSVRLLRPRRAAPAFGFSLRGGKEYATGFFITKVEFNSEAHLQGLKVGDQVVSVNGYRVDDAVHSELVHFLASQSRLKIKVRHVGMIPVKEKPHEPLSWQFVSERASVGSDVSSSPTLCHDTDRLHDLRLSILVPPRAKLGCGICKGPEWKPGIFVQFVREGGIAREAGLRPGDQILSCNGQDFANISFNEAISAMKVCGRLELVVREGAGVELVSPESSGYNSSASSAAGGERSPAPPPAALRRRLASVAEEAADRADRLTLRLKRRTWDSLDYNWKTGDIHTFDVPSDIEPDYDCPSIPNNPHTYESKSSITKKDFITAPSNRTIINLTEDGATIQCSYENQSPRKSTFTASQTNRENDKKTIVVEVHHSSNTGCSKSHCNYPSASNTEMYADAASIGSAATLSSAIADEIQRRMKNKKTCSSENSTATNPVKKLMPKPPENEKKKQHDALIDEFKKVHRRMFMNLETKEVNAENNKNETHSDSLDRQQTLPLRKLEPAALGLASNGQVSHSQTSREPLEKPPPPPPMPITNGIQNGEPTHQKDQKISQKINNTDFKLNSDINNVRKNGMLMRTPTPDYNNTKPNPPVARKLKTVNGENAELDSIESFKLKNPCNAAPKPPAHYFVKASNGSASMTKHGRPVSVTIGEYGSGDVPRREPSKLDFLNGGGDRVDGSCRTSDDTITNRLQSELALTLSRSNLRKKTEALVDTGR